MTTKSTQIHTQQDGELCITVHDEGTKRWLDFGDGGIQSIIDRDQPQRLVSPLNQAMLAALLFTPAPAQLLLLGVGGGAIARYLSHRQSGCRGDAVELSPAIAEIAQQFFEFPEHNWTLHLTDARDFAAENNVPRQHYDYIVLDIAEQQHTPHWLTEASFLANCRRRLSKQGVLSINLLPKDAADFMQQLAVIRQVFDGRTLCLSVPEHRNILVFAFAQPPEFSDITQLQRRMDELTQRWELPFSDFLERMIQEKVTEG